MRGQFFRGDNYTRGHLPRPGSSRSELIAGKTTGSFAPVRPDDEARHEVDFVVPLKEKSKARSIAAQVAVSCAEQRPKNERMDGVQACAQCF